MIFDDDHACNAPCLGARCIEYLPMINCEQEARFGFLALEGELEAALALAEDPPWYLDVWTAVRAFFMRRAD